MKHFYAHIKNEEKQTCKEHCEKTAEYAKEDLRCVGLGNSAYLAGLLHDCGKFTEDFTHYLEKAVSGENVKKGSVIHTFAGCYHLLNQYHSNPKTFSYKVIAAEILAFAIASHHGLIDIYSDNDINGFKYRLEKQPEYEEKSIKSFLEECLGSEGIDEIFKKSVDEIEGICTEIRSISKSNDEICFYISCLCRLILSSVIDGDRKDTANFMSGTDFSKCIDANKKMWNACGKNLIKMIENFPVNTSIEKARRELSDKCARFAQEESDIFKLNLPTGAGKTLSSMRYALEHAKKYNKKRIIYIAPLISILDQNASVIREALGNDKIILEHHSNVIIDKEKADELERYEILAETWDSPIIITTLVQFLNTLFLGKTTSVRRFQSLCDSVIIIDEVQSVPNKMLTLFNLMLNFLKTVCNATIVLCSATQPCFEEIEHKLLISDKTFLSDDEYKKYNETFKRTEIYEAGEFKLNEIGKLVSEEMQHTKSLLLVCNVKNQAEKVFNQIKNIEGVEKYHLSASMCIAHRKRVLSDMQKNIEKGCKVICISTQVIEAGVDISFDKVFRLNAGIDNIVQSAGRCNRNGERNELSKVGIIKCIDERLGPLKDIRASQDATIDLLDDYKKDRDKYGNDLASDEAVNYYYKSLYKNMNKDFCDYALIDKPSIYEMLSENKHYMEHKDDNEKYFIRQAFKMAGRNFEVFDGNTISVIVPYEEEGKRIIEELNSNKAKNSISYAKELLAKAKNYTVSLFDYQFKKLNEQSAIYEVCDGLALALKPSFYSENTGLKININKREEEDECDILIL